jgi:hypothetical protein
MSLDIIDGETLTTSEENGGVNTHTIMPIMMAAYGQTLADSRFKDRTKSRSTCVTSKGYLLNPDSSYRGVDFQEGWSEEQRIAAALTEAQCADAINFMQQAANITATYQQLQINQHEAELVAVQKIVLDRVWRAQNILHEAGIA